MALLHRAVELPEGPHARILEAPRRVAPVQDTLQKF